MMGMTRRSSRRAQGRAGVQIALAVGQIGMGEQHLCRMQTMLAETTFVGLHQPHLSDGGGGLQFVYGAGALFPAQALHALGDGTG